MLDGNRKPLGWTSSQSTSGVLVALCGVINGLLLAVPGHAFSWWVLGLSVLLVIIGVRQWQSGRSSARQQ